MATTIIFAVVGSYLIGAISPAYFLGRGLKEIDIRMHGSGNAGTMNVSHVIGIEAAAITACYDVGKGLLAMFLARTIGLSESVSYVCGSIAVVGHVFPFYLNFKGGQGVATTVGLLLYCLVVFLKNAWLPLISIIVIGIVCLLLLYMSRQGEVIGLIVLPFLIYEIFYQAPLLPITIFGTILILYILAINILNIIKNRTFELKQKTRETIIWWRFILRPLAVLFIIFYLLFERQIALMIIGCVALFFTVIDGVRLFHKGVNILILKNLPQAFKENETAKFSSMTIFLVSAYITFLIFNEAIAFAALSFVVFGDMFAKLFGLQYGKTTLFNKTLEGSVAFLSACIICGYILSHYFYLPIFTWSVGCLAATVAEVVPIRIDDNFSVPILSALVMVVTTVV
jgi:glycerol-3-phosphate acyltransferase PlsY